MATVLSALVWLVGTASLFLIQMIRRRETASRSAWWFALAAGGLVGHWLTTPAWIGVWPDAPGWWSVPLTMASACLYGLLAGVFNMYYFCVYNESPSNMVLHVIRRNPGISADAVATRIHAQALVTVRMDQLIADGHVAQAGEAFQARPSGRWVTAALTIYRRALGWQVG